MVSKRYTTIRDSEQINSSAEEPKKEFILTKLILNNMLEIIDIKETLIY